MEKEIKKINLPIDATNIDNSSPNNPNFSWLIKSSVVIICILGIFYGIMQGLQYFIVTKVDVETEKQIFGLKNPEEYNLIDISKLKSIQNHPKKDEIIKLFGPIIIGDNPAMGPNAYAELGGRITFTEQIFDIFQNEEDFLMVLGHEQAHINNRDVLMGLSRQIPLSLALETLGAGELVNKGADLYSLSFSREQESKADIGGITLLQSLDLNTSCATTFFEKVGTKTGKYIEFNQSHPDALKRADTIRSANKNPDKPCTPLNWKEEKHHLIIPKKTENPS